MYIGSHNLRGDMKTSKQSKTSTRMMRLDGILKKKFLRKCKRLDLQVFSYDEADKSMMCAYSVDEYQIGLSKQNTSAFIGNLYLSEEDYDKYYLED